MSKYHQTVIYSGRWVADNAGEEEIARCLTCDEQIRVDSAQGIDQAGAQIHAFIYGQHPGPPRGTPLDEIAADGCDWD